MTEQSSQAPAEQARTERARAAVRRVFAESAAAADRFRF
jgi:hypothetical protein